MERDGDANERDSGAEEEEDDQEFFEVDRILKEGESAERGVEYLIRWGGKYNTADYDSWEPAIFLQHCTDILAEWERKKAARAGGEGRRGGKRPHSVTASDASSGARAEKRRKKQSAAREHSADGSESEASVGTGDTYMSELKAKHEGTYAWKEGSRIASSSGDSDGESHASFTERERARRKKSKTTIARSPPRRFKSPPPPGRRPSQSQSLAPRGPTAAPVLPILSKSASKPASKPVYMLKRSKRPREPEASRPAPMKPNVERTVPKPLSLSRQNAWRKKRQEEPAPDVNALPVFRPADVLTAAGKSMRSGLGVQHAVGNIDTAISMVHEQIQPTSAVSEGFPREYSPRPSSRERRKSVQSDPRMEDVTSKLSDAEITSFWFNSSTQRPPETSASHLPPVSSAVNALPRSRTVSGDTAVPRKYPPPVRRLSASSASRNVEATSATSQSPSKILPTPETRTWTGELVYSSEREPLGGIRLNVPEASTRILRVPKFSGETLHLEKLVPIHFIVNKWLSPEVHRTRKPVCLAIHFINNDSEIKLADILQRTQSVGLVLEQTCTIVFFNKLNERSRSLFALDGVSNSGAIGVAILQPLNPFKSLKTSSPVDKLLNERKTAYNGLLISSNIQYVLPEKRNTPYIMFAPRESLETLEMKQILAARKARGSTFDEIPDAPLVLIHRLYSHILNYIPQLTDLKTHKRETQFTMFGSYLDWESVDGQVKSTFSSQMVNIFPSGARIVFTMDHLLEDPLNILKIMDMFAAYPSWELVIPHCMVERFDRFSPHFEKAPDIQFAFGAIREAILDKKVQVEWFQLDGMGVNDYLPFMTFLQQKFYANVRRFILIHPHPVDPTIWAKAGNGVEIMTKEKLTNSFSIERQK